MSTNKHPPPPNYSNNSRLHQTQNPRFQNRQTFEAVIMISFLDFPGELRNRIYRFCLVLENPVMVKRHRKKHEELQVVPKDATSQLLSVCKRVYGEAMPILYSENEFLFWYPDCIPDFQRIIAEKSVACVSKIGIGGLRRACPDELHDSLLESFPALRKVRFTFHRMLFEEETRPSSISELQTGTIISSGSNWMKPDSCGDPHISPDLADWVFARRDLEMTMSIHIGQDNYEDGATYVDIRTDHYRIVPIPSTSPPNSSQIGENYDLEFIKSESDLTD
ncbi:hypothetical protein FKW77_002588 [Venturia effusa]|uniref:F-box domain-containing protein n=1 Tax=Venturia effusa TaxID=50376 RepID=A0A517LNI2_9PEZI|nr:hypothetical protein FKW77_002588 [Venturia effusa]